MAITKYGKYVIRKPVKPPEPWASIDYIGETDYKSNITFFFIQVREPCTMEDSPHTHDFDMYLHFLSFDPEHMDELGAEIEIGLGKEQEIHVITTPASVYVPKGLIHCPLIFKRVDKPLLFVHTTIASKYYKKPES